MSSAVSHTAKLSGVTGVPSARRFCRHASSPPSCSSASLNRADAAAASARPISRRSCRSLSRLASSSFSRCLRIIDAYALPSSPGTLCSTSHSRTASASVYTIGLPRFSSIASSTSATTCPTCSFAMPRSTSTETSGATSGYSAGHAHRSRSATWFSASVPSGSGSSSTLTLTASPSSLSFEKQSS